MNRTCLPLSIRVPRSRLGEQLRRLLGLDLHTQMCSPRWCFQCSVIRQPQYSLFQPSGSCQESSGQSYEQCSYRPSMACCDHVTLYLQRHSQFQTEMPLHRRSHTLHHRLNHGYAHDHLLFQNPVCWEDRVCQRHNQNGYKSCQRHTLKNNPTFFMIAHKMWSAFSNREQLPVDVLHNQQLISNGTIKIQTF